MRKKPASPGKPAEVKVGAFVARIYSTPVRGRERFTLAWADPALGRRRETFADFDAAKRRAEEVARNLQNGDTEAAGFTGADRARLAAIVAALAPTGVAPEIAAAQFAEAHSILAGRSIVDAAREYARRHRLDLPAVSVVTAVEAFIEERTKAGASVRYRRDLRSRLRLGFAEQNQVHLADLTADGLRDWLERQNGGARNFNNNLAAIRTLLRFCIARRWLPKDCDLLDSIAKRKADSGAIEVWTPAEMSSLLANCPARAVPALAISAFAGLRNAELLRLDWREIHVAEGFIEVPASKAKTASRRLAHCPPNLGAWLAEHAKQTGPVWEHNEATLHDDFRKAAKGAGLEWRDNALRHSAISYRVAAVEDVAKVALESGNSPQMIFANYRQLVRPADAARWYAITPEAPGNVVAIPAAAVPGDAQPTTQEARA